MSRWDVLSLWVGFVALGTIGGWTAVTLSLGLLALVAGLARPGLTIPRPWLLPGALLLVLAVFALPFAPPPQPVSQFVGAPSYKVALVAALFTLVAMFRRNQPAEGLVLLCLGASLTMACGMTMQRDPYAWFVAAQAVCLTLALRARQPGGNRWLQLVCLVPVLALAGSAAWLLGWSETQLNEWMQNINYGLNVAVSFPNQTRLSALRNSQNSPMLIVRVFSPRPPQYLVGRSYVRYRNFAWEGEPGKAEVDGAAPDWTYDLGTGGASGVEDRYELAATQAATLLLPRDAWQLRVPCSRLVRYPGGTLQLESSASFEGLYTAQRRPGQFVQQARYEAAELEVPANLSPTVSRLAREVAGQGTPTERAGRLETWFHDHFEYGYGYPFDEARDPVEEFLTRRPAAHCELFACSLALMLRTQGIPSRYVVGFLVRERNALGGYNVVRARDAHAWVEAWLEPQGWVTLDPTPPLALAPAGGLNSWLESLGERLFYYWGKVLRQLRTNPWEVLKSLLRALVSPGVIGALSLGLFLFWLRRHGLAWLRRPSPAAEAAPVDRGALQMALLLARFEAQRGPKPSHLTLLQWLEDEPFVQDYCRVRYGQATPTPEDLERLESYLTTE